MREHNETATAAAEAPGEDESRPVILVVDDEPAKLHMLAFSLRRPPKAEPGMQPDPAYEVLEAADGAEALEIISRLILSRGRGPDVVITDVMMPGMDGFELARRLKAAPETARTPVIIQSAARTRPEDQLEGARIGDEGYLTDPGDLKLLRARVLASLKRREEGREEMAEERQKLQVELEIARDEGHRDHLTGLANVRAFEAALRREIERSGRSGTPLCLAMLDLDNLKRLNDTFGHAGGDTGLRHVGAVLLASLRLGDVPARTGGDEFAVILPGAEIGAAVEAVERVRSRLEATLVSVKMTESNVTDLDTVGQNRGTLPVVEMTRGPETEAPEAGFMGDRRPEAGFLRKAEPEAPSVEMEESKELGEKIEDDTEVWPEAGLLGQTRIGVTISGGVGQWKSGESAEQFKARVDAVLYGAKERGRNQVGF